jgi:hypothetical protein
VWQVNIGRRRELPILSRAHPAPDLLGGRQIRTERKDDMDAVVGQGKHIYRVDENWSKMPISIETKPAAVAAGSQDRVFCFDRARATAGYYRW